MVPERSAFKKRKNLKDPCDGPAAEQNQDRLHHDFDCLKFALENGVDALSQSFVESSADIEAVRRAAGALGFRPFIGIAMCLTSQGIEGRLAVLTEGPSSKYPQANNRLEIVDLSRR